MPDLTQGGIPISLIDLAIGLSLSVLLGLLAVATYRFTHRGFHYERSFLVTLVMIPPVVAVVMMLIGSNLALSLGMVGALSIIRFRTVIKDSRDMVYLFLAIAIGLGCGTYNWTVTAIAAVSLCGVLIVLHGVQFGRAVHSEFVLVLTGRGERPDAALREALRSRLEHAEVRSIHVRDGSWEMVLEVRFAEGIPLLDESSLLDELRERYGVEELSLLAPQLALPV